MTPEQNISAKQKISEKIKEIVNNGTRFIFVIDDQFGHALSSDIARLSYKYYRYTTHPLNVYDEVECNILSAIELYRKNNDCVPLIFLTNNYFVIKSAVNVCEENNIGKELAFVEWYDGDVRVCYGDNGMPDTSIIDASIELYEKEINRVLG